MRNECWSFIPDYREERVVSFYTRGEYLEYLRARQRARIADQKWNKAFANADAIIEEIFTSSSSFDHIATSLMGVQREIRILLSDPKLILQQLTLRILKDDNQDWFINVQYRGDFCSWRDKQIRTTRIIGKRRAIDMEAPMRGPEDIHSLFRRYGMSLSGRGDHMSGNYSGRVSKSAFPSISIMTMLKTPARVAALV